MHRKYVKLCRSVLVSVFFSGVIYLMTSHITFPSRNVKEQASVTRMADENGYNVNVTSVPSVPKLKYRWVEGGIPKGMEYFSPRKTRVLAMGYSFLTKPKHWCKANPFLVILVSSIHSHTNVRDAIRSTWGSIAHGQRWPGSHVLPEIKLLFIFGRSVHPQMEYIVEKESEVFNDVLLGDFVDSYKNLSLKIMTGLSFVAEYCRGANYILKADEDTFTDVPLLVEFLQAYLPSRSVLGHLEVWATVRRSGRWAVDVKECPLLHYPIYAVGNTYVLSGDLLLCFVNSSLHMHVLPIEDVFVTGVLAYICEAKHMFVEGFTNWIENAPTHCDFLMGNRLTANKVTPYLARNIWRAFQGIQDFSCESRTKSVSLPISE